MDSNGNMEEVQDEQEIRTAPRLSRLRDYRIRIPSINMRLLEQRTRKKRLLDFLKARPSVDWFRNFRISSPLAIFRRHVNDREEISLSVPSPVGIRRRFSIHFIRKIDWSSIFKMCKRWLRHPMNLALLLWLLCVAAAGLMLGMLLVGLLNNAFPSKAMRNYWIEFDNQVLNALFTLMSIYQHPILCYQFFLLCRWNSEDIIELRKVYCKDGAYRPHEWSHMMVVVILLHFTCIFQYILCGLYWGYSSDTRPEILENLFFALGILAPVTAGVYTVYSPLGREYDSESDEESQKATDAEDIKKPNKLRRRFSKRVLVNRPEWVGGLFDCNEDWTVGYLSFFCTFCVFGWNMERLGFGNMYVHIGTFILLCLAPLWILGITAMKTHNEVIEEIMGISGLVLCFFGLLYGGFWRIQMRKRFKLPRNTFCCGSGTMTDYMQWLFCWSCSLAQEVRTGNFYDVEDDSLYRRLMSGDLSALIQEGAKSPYRRSFTSTTPLPVSSMVMTPSSAIIGECSSPAPQLVVVVNPDDQMTAPVPQEPPTVAEKQVVADTEVKVEISELVSEDVITETLVKPLIRVEAIVSDSNVVSTPLAEPLLRPEERNPDGDVTEAPGSSRRELVKKTVKVVNAVSLLLILSFLWTRLPALLR
ncbi:uncharacterized protein LOC120283450 [Dioscorea cayenensis subsp. rotundata]|uniref:Uncharacterized protein LOC120283450 n=1 Tax=Dioscorea cayennensis subsp. rotundata TaxID=55577 RepID=A0AB40D137_DIOCR|nr:uncharacterized protein LOC120283450 [Dioscorea cayenensis subsp. rotundata]